MLQQSLGGQGAVTEFHRLDSPSRLLHRVTPTGCGRRCSGNRLDVHVQTDHSTSDASAEIESSVQIGMMGLPTRSESLKIYSGRHLEQVKEFTHPRPRGSGPPVVLRERSNNAA